MILVDEFTPLSQHFEGLGLVSGEGMVECPRVIRDHRLVQVEVYWEEEKKR